MDRAPRACDGVVIVPPAAGQGEKDAPVRAPSPEAGGWMRCTMTAVALRFDAFAPHPGEAGERTAGKRRYRFSAAMFRFLTSIRIFV